MPVHSTASITVLLVDDQAMTRRDVRALLEADDSFEVIGEAGSGNEAITLAEKLEPDVILMDLVMPGMNGTEATRRILAARPGARIIGCSLYDEPAFQQAMLAAGAVGFVGKAALEEELAVALRKSVGATPKPAIE